MKNKHKPNTPYKIKEPYFQNFGATFIFVPKKIHHKFTNKMMNGNGGLKGIQRVGFLSTTASKGSSSHRCVRFPTKCLSDFNDYAVLGLSPFASKSDVKFAYKRLALKYHPDVLKGDHVARNKETFREIKSAYESLMQKFEEEEELQAMQSYQEADEWDEWMGFEGGMPASAYQSF